MPYFIAENAYFDQKLQKQMTGPEASPGHFKHTLKNTHTKT